MTVRTHLPRLMGQVAELKVPLVVEVGIGSNWEAVHWTGLRAENYCNEVTGGQF
jgi:hypothetical protein